MKDEKKNKRQLISELEAFRGKLARYEEKSRLKPEHEIAIHLQRANRALRVISEFNQRLVRADKEQELLEVVCRILVNIGRYRFAWVGFARQDRAGTVQPVAQFGFEADYLEKVKISWRNNRYGQGPTGRAIREKKPAVSRYILTDPNFAPWRKEAIMRGYASSIALPLVQENRVLGALNIYAAEPDAFDADEIKLLTELANDLAFGVLSIRDKKENDEAQKKLVESEEKFRSIVEYSHAGILLLDDAYHITYANKQIYTISGFSQRELIGRDFRELFDSKTKKEVLSRYRKRLKGEPLSSTFAFNLRRKDGALRWVESRSSTFTDREGKTHTIAQLLDTTQKKKTEEALREELKRNRLILQTTLDGYILADTNGKIIDVNPSYCEMVQYSREELLKMNIRDVEVQIPLEEIDRRIKQMVGKGWDRFETRHRCKDGTVLDLEVSIVIMQHEEESLVAAFVRDITDRKRAEERLRRTTIQLRALSAHLQTVREEERSQIAHEIHDELGQALTVLKMDTAWLAKKLSPGTELLRKKIQSMSQLIDNTIKVVQRVSSELKPSILEDLGLTAAVEWQTLEFEKRSGISCEVNFAMKKNVVLPHKLELTLFRILQETLTNVYRHARASKVKVELKEKSNRIILKIEDNGVGIKESQLSDPASFGLLGMRERIFPWGGKVDIRGIDQKGTTVTVTVPLTIQQEKWDD